MPPEVRQAHKTSLITYFRKMRAWNHFGRVYMYVCVFVSFHLANSLPRQRDEARGRKCLCSATSQQLPSERETPSARAQTAAHGTEDSRRCCCWCWWPTRENRTLCSLLGADREGSWLKSSVEVALQVSKVLKPQFPDTAHLKPFSTLQTVGPWPMTSRSLSQEQQIPVPGAATVQRSSGVTWPGAVHTCSSHKITRELVARPQVYPQGWKPEMLGPAQSQNTCLWDIQSAWNRGHRGPIRNSILAL